MLPVIDGPMTASSKVLGVPKFGSLASMSAALRSRPAIGVCSIPSTVLGCGICAAARIGAISTTCENCERRPPASLIFAGEVTTMRYGNRQSARARASSTGTATIQPRPVRRVVPFAESRRAISVVAQDGAPHWPCSWARHCCGRVACGQLDDSAHPNQMMVAPGEQSGTGGRANCRGVKHPGCAYQPVRAWLFPIKIDKRVGAAWCD